MKKFLYIIIGIFIGWIIFAQTNAISNWTQTVWKNNIYWIFSPNKNNLEAIPNISIHPDSRLWVWLTNENSITDSSFRSWDVIAKRYCFENSKECVSTFQQSISNIITFSPNVSINKTKAKDSNNNPYINELNKPFFMVIDSEFLNNIWMDPDYGTGEFRGQQATNWFDIGYWDFYILNGTPRQFFVENSNNFFPYSVTLKNQPFIPWGSRKLVSCHKIDSDWIKRPYFNTKNCSSWNIDTVNYCDLNSKICWVTVIEFRLTINNVEARHWCENYEYWPKLRYYSWYNEKLFKTLTTEYYRINEYLNNISDTCKKLPNIKSKVQARIVMSSYRDIPAQSLVEKIKIQSNIVGIGRFGISLLQ